MIPPFVAFTCSDNAAIRKLRFELLCVNLHIKIWRQPDTVSETSLKSRITVTQHVVPSTNMWCQNQGDGLRQPDTATIILPGAPHICELWNRWNYDVSCVWLVLRMTHLMRYFSYAWLISGLSYVWLILYRVSICTCAYGVLGKLWKHSTFHRFR